MPSNDFGDHLFQRHARTMEMVAAQLVRANNVIASAQKRLSRSTELLEKRAWDADLRSKPGLSHTARNTQPPSVSRRGPLLSYPSPAGLSLPKRIEQLQAPKPAEDERAS